MQVGIFEFISEIYLNVIDFDIVIYSLFAVHQGVIHLKDPDAQTA